MTRSPRACGALRVRPRGAQWGGGAALELNPQSASFIKQEPHTLIWREGLPDGTVAAVKFYRHGFAGWLRSRATAFRVDREYCGLLELERLGIPCSEPLFWAHGWFGTYGWGQVLATRWLPDCEPLAAFLKSRKAGQPCPDAKAIFADVARMHGAGLRHGTLLSRNILLQAGASGPRFFFIDLPRFHRFPRSIAGTRMAHFDLLFLCETLAPYYPAEEVGTWLEAYGMPPSARPAFRAALRGFRNTSRLRRVIGAEFNVRYLLAGGAWRVPPVPGPVVRRPGGGSG